MATNANHVHKSKLGILDRIAIAITKVVGTMWCALAFTVLALISLPQAIHGGVGTTISWIAQTFLQLVLLSIIMVGQDLQNRHSEARADATYHLTVKIEKILEHLEKNTDKK